MIRYLLTVLTQKLSMYAVLSVYSFSKWPTKVMRRYLFGNFFVVDQSFRALWNINSKDYTNRGKKHERYDVLHLTIQQEELLQSLYPKTGTFDIA